MVVAFSTTHYIVVTGHFIDNWEMNSVVLEFSHTKDSETATFLASYIESLFFPPLFPLFLLNKNVRDLTS